MQSFSSPEASSEVDWEGGTGEEEDTETLRWPPSNEVLVASSEDESSNAPSPTWCLFEFRLEPAGLELVFREEKPVCLLGIRRDLCVEVLL